MNARLVAALGSTWLHGGRVLAFSIFNVEPR